jgi:hypothetical protein
MGRVYRRGRGVHRGKKRPVSSGQKHLLSNPWEMTGIEEVLTAKSNKFLGQHPSFFDFVVEFSSEISRI